MSDNEQFFPVGFDDDLDSLHRLVNLIMERKVGRISDIVVDAELEKAAVALAQLVAAKAVLHKRYVEDMIHSTESNI
jgi:hypothetical protein